MSLVALPLYASQLNPSGVPLIVTVCCSRFNILHTAPDVNFDRIAHLAKLVFHAKWVLISLVDKDEQYVI